MEYPVSKNKYLNCTIDFENVINFHCFEILLFHIIIKHFNIKISILKFFKYFKNAKINCFGKLFLKINK